MGNAVLVVLNGIFIEDPGTDYLLRKTFSCPKSKQSRLKSHKTLPRHSFISPPIIGGGAFCLKRISAMLENPSRAVNFTSVDETMIMMYVLVATSSTNGPIKCENSEISSRLKLPECLCFKKQHIS